MSVKFVCDFCNAYEFENDNAELVQEMVYKHSLTHVKSNLVNDIEDFHSKFGLHPQEDRPHLLSNELQTFRVNFLQEELTEFQDAYDKGNLEGAFDALIDLVYVALGTAYLMDLPFNAGWQKVHYCNMQKVRTKIETDSKRNSSYDVIKPKDWKAPDLKELIHDKCLVCGGYHGDNMPCPKMDITCK